MARSPLPPCAAPNSREARLSSAPLAHSRVSRCQPDSCVGGDCAGGVEQQGELQPVGRQERGECAGCSHFIK